MCKSLARMALIVFAIVMGSSSASAQVQITIGNTGTGTVTVIGTAGNIAIQLGTCTGGGGTPPCTLTSAVANASLSTSPGNLGSYVFATTGSSLPAFTQSSPGSGTFQCGTNCSGTTFSISTGIGSTGLGSIMMSLIFNTITGGTDPSNAATFHGLYTVTNVSGASDLLLFFPQNATNNFDFNVTTGTTLQNIFNSGGTTTGNITSGAFHTPEPASIALFGSGLLLLGRVLRRRKTSARAQSSEE